MLDLLRKRKSTRSYLKKEIEKNIVNMLLEAALLSPSSRNIKPWEFVIIDDKKIIEQLALSKEHGSEFLKEAPLIIAVIADKTASDVWVEDCSIASIIIQLEAESLGLGSCWVQIRCRETKEKEKSEDFVKKLLKIPQQYGVESLIGIGYPKENSKSNNKSLTWEKCSYNNFGIASL
ncbi:MAG: nitroreductase family protein [Spirochaetaceae bacterium]|nr:nitroreductase family protein [Spirochaetaceae bacterium]MCL2705408.1 nitroreductase family protein [Spirochaetaceae bacterium]